MNKLINKDVLIAAKIASKSPIKPALASVFITPEKIIATDSFKALIIDRIDDVNSEDFPVAEPKANLSDEGVLIKADQLLKKLKFTKNKTLEIINEKALLVEKDDSVDIITTDLETTDTVNFRKVDDSFPDVEALIPTDEPKVSADFSPIMLIELLEAFKEKSLLETITIEMRGSDEVLIIKSKNKTGLIMPKVK